MKRNIILISALLMASVTYAQDVITGIVVDDNGDELIGATIKPTNGKGGATTLKDGTFSLNTDGSVKSFVVSYLGFTSKVVKVNPKTKTYKIALQPDAQSIKDVVVIGYGTVKKGDVTASVSKVDGETIEDRPNTNVASLLQGQLAGVEIRNTSGAPGGETTINVRGSVTLNDPEATGDFTDNTNPLYVVDGIPMDESFDLSDLDAHDLASIEVLKDASSSAIYGSRGANGVILVTTKGTQKQGKFNISVTANFSLQQVNRTLDVMSGSEWAQWMSKITDTRYGNQWSSQGAQSGDGEIIKSLLNGHAAYTDYTTYRGDMRWNIPGHPGISYIDWQKQMFRIAPQQQYGIAASGSTKQGNYRISVNYTDQDGIIKGTGYKRISASLSGQTTINKITFGVSAAPSFAVYTGPSTSGGSSSDKTNLGILTMVPIAEDNAGIYTGSYPYDNYAWASKTASNAFVKLDRIQRERQLFNLRSTAFINADIMKGLKARLTGSWNMRHEARRNFVPSNTVSNYYYVGEGVNSSAYWWDKKNHSFTLQAQVDYNKKWDKHTLSAMAGWSLSASMYSDDIRTEAENFVGDGIESFTHATADVTSVKNTITTNSHMISYFGRAIYNYDDRYLLNASVRRDGSSKFGLNNQWATFPAFSAAWRISNEKFWPKGFFINSAKARMSYGLNGRNNIRTDAIRTTLSPKVYYFGDNRSRGYGLNNMGNNDLGWQKVDSWDVALDLGFMKNRLSLSVDYYYKRTRNLLYQLSLPAISGYSKAYFNIGSIANKGVDLELRSINLVKPLKWVTTLNLGFQTSKVLDLGGNDKIESGYNARGGGGKTQILEVGRAVGDYYLYDAIGVFTSQEELDNYPHITGATVGSIKLRDTDGDGKITSNDRIYAGNPRPDVTFGLINNFQWKNWNLNVTVTGQFGGKIFAATGFTGPLDSPLGATPTKNMMSWFQDMYYSEQDPGNGNVPCVWGPKGYGNTTRNLYSSDYIKLQNITLGYLLKLSPKAIVRSLTFQLSVENALQWDRYDAGYSPEGAIRTSSTSTYDEVAYPLARIYCLGLKLNL